MTHNHTSAIVLRDPLLRPETAAHYLGIKRIELNWLRSRSGASGLRAVKFGPVVCFRASDVLSLARARRTDTEWAKTLVRTDNGSLLRVDDAARYLSISAATLYHWRSARPGYGPRAVKFGGSVRYRVVDLNRWVERHLDGPRA
jgi:predicted DNA-binding transcriptional regulator AlpA